MNSLFGKRPPVAFYSLQLLSEKQLGGFHPMTLPSPAWAAEGTTSTPPVFTPVTLAWVLKPFKKPQAQYLAFYQFPAPQGLLTLVF